MKKTTATAPAAKNQEETLYWELRELDTKLHGRIMRKLHQADLLDLFKLQHRLETTVAKENNGSSYQAEHVHLLHFVNSKLSSVMEQVRKEGAA